MCGIGVSVRFSDMDMDIKESSPCLFKKYSAKLTVPFLAGALVPCMTVVAGFRASFS